MTFSIAISKYRIANLSGNMCLGDNWNRCCAIQSQPLQLLTLQINKRDNAGTEWPQNMYKGQIRNVCTG